MATVSVQTQHDYSLPTQSSDEVASVFRQLKDFRSRVPKDLLASWERPSGFLTMYNIVRDWGIILASSQLYIRHPSALTFVIAVSIMTWGQRGLSNLAHDSIHSNLVIGKKWNDIVANTFLAPAFLTTAQLQRQSHTAHHHYLGTAEDPDHGLNNDTSLKHYRTGKQPGNSIFSIFIYDVLDPILWYNSAIGSFTSAPLFLTTWWVLVALFTSLLEPTSGSLPIGYNFLLLYHVTRLTLTHAFYVLRETIDHSGLAPTNILAFTRTSPGRNAFQEFLQPHNDCYHLLHHLLPRIPMTRLHEAHEWLVANCDIYEKANNRHTTYLSGDNALFGEIVRQVDAGFEDEDSAVVEKKGLMPKDRDF